MKRNFETLSKIPDVVYVITQLDESERNDAATSMIKSFKKYIIRSQSIYQHKISDCSYNSELFSDLFDNLKLQDQITFIRNLSDLEENPKNNLFIHSNIFILLRLIISSLSKTNPRILFDKCINDFRNSFHEARIKRSLPSQPQPHTYAIDNTENVLYQADIIDDYILGHLTKSELLIFEDIDQDIVKKVAMTAKLSEKDASKWIWLEYFKFAMFLKSDDDRKILIDLFDPEILKGLKSLGDIYAGSMNLYRFIRNHIPLVYRRNFIEKCIVNVLSSGTLGYCLSLTENTNDQLYLSGIALQQQEFLTFEEQYTFRFDSICISLSPRTNLLFLDENIDFVLKHIVFKDFTELLNTRIPQESLASLFFKHLNHPNLDHEKFCAVIKKLNMRLPILLFLQKRMEIIKPEDYEKFVNSSIKNIIFSLGLADKDRESFLTLLGALIEKSKIYFSEVRETIAGHLNHIKELSGLVAQYSDIPNNHSQNLNSFFCFKTISQFEFAQEDRGEWLEATYGYTV